MLLEKKGAIRITIPIFSDRYEALECIYHTSATQIYLVRHRSLGKKRILKVISKQFFQGLSYEADVLCSLRHTGIPILYDYGEDEESICLIEEYIRGVSLTEYLLYHSTITRDWVRQTMQQLGDILMYLHDRKNPILYQDLKPDHIMIQGNQVILIDYGIAHPKNQRRYGAGTKGHSAPEQFREASVDERSDLYALGNVAKLLLAHQSEKPTAKELAVMEWAMEEKPENRPNGVSEWISAYLAVVPEHHRKRGMHLFQTIAVIGAEEKVGTTHIAIALTSYLNRQHHRAYFENQTEDATVTRILQNRGEFHEKDGIIYHNSFAAVQDVGPAIPVTTPPEGIRVIDCGTDWDMARGSDFYLYVIGSRPWMDMDYSLEKAMNPHTHVIINPCNKGVGRMIASKMKKQVLAFPLDSDPFLVTKEKEKLFHHIWESEERSEGIRK